MSARDSMKFQKSRFLKSVVPLLVVGLLWPAHCGESRTEQSVFAPISTRPEMKLVLLADLPENYRANPYLFGAAQNLENLLNTDQDTVEYSVYLANELYGSRLLIQMKARQEEALRQSLRQLRNFAFNNFTQNLRLYYFEVLPELSQLLGSEKNLIFQVLKKKDSYRNKSAEARLRLIRQEHRSYYYYSRDYKLENYDLETLFPRDRFGFDYGRLIAYNGPPVYYRARFHGLEKTANQEGDSIKILFQGRRLDPRGLYNQIRQ